MMKEEYLSVKLEDSAMKTKRPTGSSVFEWTFGTGNCEHPHTSPQWIIIIIITTTV